MAYPRKRLERSFYYVINAKGQYLSPKNRFGNWSNVHFHPTRGAANMYCNKKAGEQVLRVIIAEPTPSASDRHSNR